MFGRLMKWIGEAASSVATRYALRASVVIPFAFAVGFAIAGLAVYLAELFGHRNAYFLMAAGFAAFGVVAALIVRWREKREDEEAAKDSAASSVATAAKVAVSVPAAIMQGAAEARGPSNQWAEMLKGWPLYGVALGLLLIASLSRSGEAHHRYRRI